MGVRERTRARLAAVEVLSSRVILRVSDFARSRSFYEETIGLRTYREYGTGGRVTGVVYFLGGGFLEITAGDPDESRAAVLWLQVPDLAVEAERLVAAGVPVRKRAERMPWGLLELWIEDPDGVELRVIEVPPDHPLRRRV
jgi:predicted enzyme related to lactoylglutathione lyase